MIIIKYYVDLPYPKIRVERPNLDYAKLLSNIYAGEISEESSIHLYIYQHISLKNSYPEYSEVLKRIAIVEMHHLDMLGELISLLGMKPIFMSFNDIKNTFIPWNSSYINYYINIHEIIDEDIRVETNAIKCYKYLSTVIKDQYIRDLLERIILDEELHLKIFNEYKRKYN